MRWVHLILVFVLRREVPAGQGPAFRHTNTEATEAYTGGHSLVAHSIAQSNCVQVHNIWPCILPIFADPKVAAQYTYRKPSRKRQCKLHAFDEKTTRTTQRTTVVSAI